MKSNQKIIEKLKQVGLTEEEIRELWTYPAVERLADKIISLTIGDNGENMNTLELCSVSDASTEINSGRTGTVIAEKAKLIELFGQPLDVTGEDDGKVKMIWNISTPAGNVHMRDYWRNASDEWSLSAENNEANEQAIAFLQSKGLEANREMRKV